MELMARYDHDDEWDDDIGWIDEPAAPRRATKAVAAPAAPPVSASEQAPPDPDAPLELEDDDWHVEPPPVPTRRPADGAGSSRAATRRRRGPLGSPVVLLAIYSIGGIALIVLAVNLLSGSFRGGDDPAPVKAAADRVPAAETAPATPTPAATEAPSVSDFELGRRETAATSARDAAIADSTRAVRAARAAERRRIARERRARAARARARTKAAARERRNATPPAAAATPPAIAPAAPTPVPAPAPAPSGGGGGGNSCEFCIG